MRQKLWFTLLYASCLTLRCATLTSYFCLKGDNAVYLRYCNERFAPHSYPKLTKITRMGNCFANPHLADPILLRNYVGIAGELNPGQNATWSGTPKLSRALKLWFFESLFRVIFESTFESILIHNDFRIHFNSILHRFLHHFTGHIWIDFWINLESQWFSNALPTQFCIIFE